MRKKIEELLGEIRREILILSPQKIKWRIWNAGLLIWWYRLYIRRDEFHKSLSVDPFAMISMNKEDRKNYFNDLIRRRNIAHKR